MSEDLSRRFFLGLMPALPLLARAAESRVPLAIAEGATPGPGLPSQEPALVRDAVVAAHGNLARMTELVAARPALARTAWDRGFGDWETAIDGASHVGNRPIAELLLAHGARPTIYTAAMLGQLAVVKGLIEALPGVQRNRGPHGITLLAHARAGGAAAVDVARYLESLGDADPRYSNLPVEPEQEEALVGTNGVGPDPDQRLTVAKNARGLTIQRTGASERPLFHQGGLVFHP